MHQMALQEFDRDEADLWQIWKQSKIDKINNMDKMICLRVDSRVKAMYITKYPNMQQTQSWNNNNSVNANTIDTTISISQNFKIF